MVHKFIYDLDYRLLEEIEIDGENGTYDLKHILRTLFSTCVAAGLVEAACNNKKILDYMA